MKNLGLFKRAAEIVTFLFATFSGLLKTAPPEIGSFATGLASFLAFVILLVSSILARRASKQQLIKYWLIGGIVFAIGATGGAVYYQRAFQSLTFSYFARGEELRVVGGCVATEQAQQQFAQGFSPEDLLKNKGGLSKIHDLWDEGSQECARDRLLLRYSFLVICVASCIFSLLEAASASMGNPQTKSAREELET